MTVRVEPLVGAAVMRGLPALARLRIAVFREWPYLYDGTLAYEQRYLEKFSKSADAVIVAAIDGEEIVGVSTGTPLIGHADAFAEPLRARGFDVERVFYFGESVLLPQYRGQGVGNQFFDQREAHARKLGRYTHTTFCAVVRPDDHPLKPPGYRPLDAFWGKRGYRKVDGVIGSFGWLDIGASEQTEKPMQFWMKAL